MLRLQAPSKLKSFTMLHVKIMTSTSKGEIIKTKTIIIFKKQVANVSGDPMSK